MNNEKKAREYITESLFLLMKQKDYQSITITDITKRAGVNRVTFYRNFNSKDEIINKYLEKSFNDWGKRWEESGDTNIPYQLFKYFDEQRDFISLLYKSNLQNFLIDYIVLICNSQKEENNILAYMKSMFAYGLFGFCNEWYLRGMQETPEDMIKLLDNTKNTNQQ